MSKIFAVNSDGTLAQKSYTVEEFVKAANGSTPLIGRFRGVPNETYHRALPHLSNTNLGEINRSINHFFEARINPPDPTPALIFGNAFHELILEPKIFEENWIEKPDFASIPGVTKKDQEEKWKSENDEHAWDGMPKFSPIKAITKKAQEEEWFATHAQGKQIISIDELINLRGMAKKVSEHPILSEMLQGGIAEDVFLAVDPETGVPIKCKADFLHNSGEVNLDMKSTNDASFFDFQKSVANFEYHRQMSFYSHVIALVTGKAPKHNVTGSVEKKAPWNVAVYRLDDASLEVGESKWKNALAKFAAYRKEKQESGSAWGGYSLEVIDMNLPAWAFNREE